MLQKNLTIWFFVSLLAGCGLVPKGTPVCVGGFGQCGTSTTSGPSTTLTITASANTITVRDQVTLTASGGTAPYTFTNTSTIGGSLAVPSSTTATYSPPSGLTTQTSVTIKVTDTENPAVSATSTITINP